jgi:5-carboxymethyl-2-hydroxymuconate isomerase
MPHFILKHSNSVLDKNVSYQQLFSEIADVIEDQEFCDPKAIKCYLMNPTYSYLPARDMFIHCDLLILKRDNLEIINNKVKKIAEIIKNYFINSFNQDNEILSIEVRHMNKEDYHKGTIIKI